MIKKTSKCSYFLHLLGFLLITNSLFSQDKFSFSGTIKDAASGESLIGAAVYVPKVKTGIASNEYGYFAVRLPKDSYEIKISFIGYNPQIINIKLDKDITANVNLELASTEIGEVQIVGERKDKNISEVKMGSNVLKMETIKKLPSFLGEVDALKTISLLPEVQASGEGQTGYNVRGGSIDQNLVLLDEAPIYNPSHFLGFFSVFNSDAIKDLELYKGGIPARYGGRLSSILDIKMKEGNNKRFSGAGGIGLISSRLYLDGPIQKNKGSFMLSARRTYADLFLFLSDNEAINDSKLYFYDLNAKANYQLNSKNRIYLSAYLGRDVLSLSDQILVNWGNTSATLRWNHIYGPRLFANLTFIVSNFDYVIGIPDGSQEFTSTSRILDFNLKKDFTYYLNPKNTLQFGLGSIFHTFSPAKIEAADVSFVNNIEFPKSYAFEHHSYASLESEISARWAVEFGLRLSVFQNIGSGKVYEFNKSNPEKYTLVDSTSYNNGQLINTYSNLEPRLSARYLINEFSSLKANYQRTAQYIQQAVNSTSSSPFNTYFPSSPNIKPQLADQVSIGYFRNFNDNKYEFSVETYYKYLQNVIDFRDHAEIFFNQYVEGEVRTGKAQAYGVEFLLRKNSGNFNGWVSYTLSRAERTIPEINGGKQFLAPYNRTHDVSVVLNYEFSKRWQFGLIWIYATGRPITVPSGKFEYADTYIPVYSDRNAVEMPAYHRMDVSATYYFKDKVNKKGNFKWESNLNFSVFNAYNRHNPFTINFKRRAGTQETYAEQTYFFGIVPAVTYNFKF